MGSISVAVADDHPVFRSGIEAIIEEEERLELVGSASNGKEALEIVDRLQPDVLLLDMSMPEMDGLEVARKLVQKRSKTRALPLSGHVESEYVLGAMDAGVRGYLLKDEKPSVIADAIVHVSNGGVYISSRLFDVLNKTTSHRIVSTRERAQSLVEELAITPRLLEVLVEAAQGLTNEEIGDQLYKSPHTVRNQIESLKSIAGVSSRPALVAWAWRNGLNQLWDTNTSI